MRRRFVYRPNHETGDVESIEVSPDYQRHEERQPVFTDRYMEGTRSPVDGSDISSRAKRKAHMQAHSLVDADDYKGEWAKGRARREEFQRTGNDGIDWGGRLQSMLERMQRNRRG